MPLPQLDLEPRLSSRVGGPVGSSTAGKRGLCRAVLLRCAVLLLLGRGCMPACLQVRYDIMASPSLNMRFWPLEGGRAPRAWAGCVCGGGGQGAQGQGPRRRTHDARPPCLLLLPLLLLQTWLPYWPASWQCWRRPGLELC